MNGILKVGEPLKRFEDESLLRGEGQFVDNLDMQDQVFLHFHRSVIAHGRIQTIHVEKAREMPGVLGIFTGKDLLEDEVRPVPVNMPFTREDGSPATSAPYFPLATDAVRFAGQAVAMVIAETAIQAEDAAECIEVEYEELPVLTSLAEAVKPDAPKIWNEISDNVAAAKTLGNQEEVDAAFRKAHHITKLELVNPRLIGNPIEPRTSICEYDPESGSRTLHAGHQAPWRLKNGFAVISGVDSVPKLLCIRKMRLWFTHPGNSNATSAGGPAGVMNFTPRFMPVTSKPLLKWPSTRMGKSWRCGRKPWPMWEGT